MKIILKELTQQRAGTAAFQCEPPRACTENPAAEINICSNKHSTLAVALEEIKNNRFHAIVSNSPHIRRGLLHPNDLPVF